MINSLYNVARDLYATFQLTLLCAVEKNKAQLQVYFKLKNSRRYSLNPLQMRTGAFLTQNFKCLLITPTTGKTIK